MRWEQGRDEMGGFVWIDFKCTGFLSDFGHLRKDSLFGHFL